MINLSEDAVYNLSMFLLENENRIAAGEKGFERLRSVFSSYFGREAKFI